MKSFGLENVKAFKNTGEKEIAPITVFVGKNSCGKSSFIRFLAMLAQTVIDGVYPLCLHSEQSKIIDYGSYKDVIYKHDVKGTISYRISYDYERLNVSKERIREIFRDTMDRQYDDLDLGDECPPVEEISQLQKNRDNEVQSSDSIDAAMKKLADDLDACQNSINKAQCALNSATIELLDSYNESGVVDIEEECDKARPEIVHLRITCARDCQTKSLFVTSFQIVFDQDTTPFFEVVVDQSTGQYLLYLRKTICGNHLENVDYKLSTNPSGASLLLHLDSNEITARIIKNALHLDEKAYRDVLKRLKLVESLRFGDSLSYALDNYSEFQFDYDELKKCYQAFQYALLIVEALETTVQHEVRELSYIGPFRNNPERIYRRSENKVANVGVKGEFAINMLIDDRGRSRITEKVSDWFEKAFHYKLKIEPLVSTLHTVGESEYYQVMLENTDTSIENSIMDVGYGISQVLPIVSQMAMEKDNNDNSEMHIVDYDSLYIIEQPELHLHPNAQAELAKLFANTVSTGKATNKKVLIETHSEHIIRGLQILIADKDSPYNISADKVKIYYVHDEKEKDGQEGSWIEEMKMDEYGQFIDKWPPDFFDKAYNLTREFANKVRAHTRGTSI